MVLMDARSVGRHLSHYKSGAIPKPFKLIPTLTNWEEILALTAPESWTPHATYYATRLFASGLKEKMAQRYVELLGGYIDGDSRAGFITCFYCRRSEKMCDSTNG